MYFMTCSSSESLTHIYGPWKTWTPLYMLFQPTLAMYSFLIVMRLVLCHILSAYQSMSPFVPIYSCVSVLLVITADEGPRTETFCNKCCQSATISSLKPSQVIITVHFTSRCHCSSYKIHPGFPFCFSPTCKAKPGTENLRSRLVSCICTNDGTWCPHYTTIDSG